jgi:diguanylate cyclase (GGDEF)-like protein
MCRCTAVGNGSSPNTAEPRDRFAPHRAIAFLGALLIVVAIAGGTIGVVNSSQAEHLTSVLSDRYLVLQPPVRAMRASVADFQILADRAFGGSVTSTALVVAAEADSTATDRAYLTLQRLLALPENAGLAPGLSKAMTTYSAARSDLGAFLAGKAATTQLTHLSVAEQSADSALDATLGSLQATITNRLLQTATQAGKAAEAARRGLLWSMAIGVPFAAIVTALLTWRAIKKESEFDQRESVQASLTGRNEFEAQLQRALEMSKTEPPLFKVVAEALGDAAPDMHSELLLADSSRAHFRQVLVGSPQPEATGCGVMSPEDCPAASRGQTMVFPSSTALDTCPNLRGRACSALCVPVNISGSSIGVFHVTALDGSPPSDSVRSDVEVVARRSSERLAMLRAFALSQTQANSDSLTGLMTRRSLENGVRVLQEDGVQYTVAYGDLDHFKQLNDVFGHDAGDRALRTFSQVLRDSLRPADIPCRYGGEEFVIVLPSCPLSEAVHVLERVRQSIASRLAVAQLPAFTVSFGLASSEQAEGFEELVALADGALLRAKGGGRDQIVIAVDTDHEASDGGEGDRLPASGQASGSHPRPVTFVA